MPTAAASLARYRVGSVPYLNAVPLTYGIESAVRFLPPSALAEELRAGRLDTALVSVTEPLLHEGYRILDGFGITSRGTVASVFLAHRGPLEEVRSVWVDTASGTSVNLLRVLLAERGLHPEFLPLAGYADAPNLDNVLLIGNPAIEFRRAPHAHRLWDLGEAWRELAGLPFVYAVWAVRDGVGLEPLASALRAAAKSGIRAIPELVEQRRDFDSDFHRAYLGGYIRYELGTAEKAGLKRFAELLMKHTGQLVYPPRYV